MEYKLSPSSLNLLQDCPRCFWLHFNKKIKRPSSSMARIANKIDSITKIYFNNHRETGQLPPIVAGQVEGKLAKDVPQILNKRYTAYFGWSEISRRMVMPQILNKKKIGRAR